MITFRHFLTSIVAVFLALAVGIALGGGPLSSVGDDQKPTGAAPATDMAAPGGYAEAFATAVSPTLLDGALADRPVAVVTVPGVDEQVLAQLAEQIAAAGGSVSGRYSLTDAMVSPSEKALVDTLGSQLMSQQGKAIPADASTYERIGQLVGLAVATTSEAGDEPNSKQASITQSLVGADLLSLDGDVDKRAPLVLLVLGAQPDPEGGDAILSGMATGLARAATGVVVVGKVADGSADAADGADGQIARLRAEPVSAEVTTVDGIDTAAGRATTVLALARALTTRGGAFGASGADGAVPLG